MTLSEWPEGTRIEIAGNNRRYLYYRDDSGSRFRHWWGAGDCGPVSWTELLRQFGEAALAAAVPLYSPAETRPAAVRPIHVVLGQENGEPYAWCYSDADDARDAYATGCGDRILPAVLLGPGVRAQVVRVYTGWARVGRDGEGDTAPSIVREVDTWMAPGAVATLIATGSDQAGAVATLGVDVFDIWAAGPDVEAVLVSLDARYTALCANRQAAIEWAPTAAIVM